jgi:hypothetical protein
VPGTAIAADLLWRKDDAGRPIRPLGVRVHLGPREKAANNAVLANASFKSAAERIAPAHEGGQGYMIRWHLGTAWTTEGGHSVVWEAGSLGQAAAAAADARRKAAAGQPAALRSSGSPGGTRCAGMRGALASVHWRAPTTVKCGGRLDEAFSSTRGVRQGDPVVPSVAEL